MNLDWHRHHEAFSPLEISIETYEERLHVIHTVKAEQETPEQTTRRLELFKPFQGELPEPLKAAYDAQKKARVEEKKTQAAWKKALGIYKTTGTMKQEPKAAWHNAVAEWNKTNEAWKETLTINFSLILKLHAEQCGCGWTPEQRNIFKYTEG